jgi:selenide,water dikinase
MSRYPVHACSDITGYALLGHAMEMASGSSVTLILESAKLPLFDNTVDLAEAGHLTGGCKRNREFLSDKIIIDSSIREGLVEAALDPQTSGGLLIALPGKDAPRLEQELKANGIESATIIGYVTSRQEAGVRLV